MLPPRGRGTGGWEGAQAEGHRGARGTAPLCNLSLGRPKASPAV